MLSSTENAYTFWRCYGEGIKWFILVYAIQVLGRWRRKRTIRLPSKHHHFHLPALPERRIAIKGKSQCQFCVFGPIQPEIEPTTHDRHPLDLIHTVTVVMSQWNAFCDYFMLLSRMCHILFTVCAKLLFICTNTACNNNTGLTRKVMCDCKRRYEIHFYLRPLIISRLQRSRIQIIGLSLYADSKRLD